MTARPAAAGEFVFATPAEWFPIKLPGDSAEARGLARIIEDARPELAGQHDALEEMLSGLAAAAAAVHAVAAYGTLLDASATWLPATVLVSVQQMDGSSLDEIGREISGADAVIAPHVDVFDLPAGRTIRIERLAERPYRTDARRPVSFTVTYLTEVPGRDQAVVLTFGTPAIALIDQVRPLFHQIACSLLINPAGPVQLPAEAR
jgi:hypothetical protein